VTPPGPLAPSTETAAIIGDRFGLRATEFAAAPAARGLCGRVWRLDTADGPYALKELFWPTDHDERQIRAQVAFESAARDVGVLSPESFPTLDGDYLCHLPDGCLVRLFGWIEGDLLTGSDGAAHWLGQTLSRLHRLPNPVVGEPDTRFESPPDGWDDLLAALRRQQVAWADDLAKALPQVLELAALVRPAGRDDWVMCHQDIVPSNVMRTPAGDLVLIDWDNTGPALADQELAAALMNWHVVGDHVDTEGIAATLAAYEAGGGPARLTGRAAFSAYLGAFLADLRTQATVAISDDLDAEHREVAVARVAHRLAGLPGTATLDEVLRLDRQRSTT
jgi:Ser/Thr protein kinase RdoA (MazF antagonist)